jgi:hypothetical protein
MPRKIPKDAFPEVPRDVLAPVPPAVKAAIKRAAAQLAKAQGEVERVMRAIAARPEVGPVRLTLAASGGFFAHAYPDRLSAMDEARAALVAEAKAKRAGEVVGLDDVNDALREAQERALAVGIGTSALDALLHLERELERNARRAGA